MINYSIKYGSSIIVKVDGHADYSDEGTDIVCASVSSIMTMTVNLVDNFGYKFKDVKLEKGFSSFEIISDDVTKKIVTTLEELLDSLAKKYPNYIKRIS